jgi:uncharacterized small protein (DUF1192 family)
MARTRRSKGGGAKRTVKATVRRPRAAAPRTGAGGDLLKAVHGLVNALPVGELEKRLAGLEKSVEKIEVELRKALAQVASAVRGGGAKRAPAKRRGVKRAAKRTPAAKRTVKRAPAAKRTVKRAPAAKRTVKRAPAVKRTVKRTPAVKRAPAVKRTAVKRAAPRRTVKRTPPPAAPSAPAAPPAP